ncbi:hypothetical protein ACFQZC_31260 [Streptacidiphilus monticola]
MPGPWPATPPRRPTSCRPPCANGSWRRSALPPTTRQALLLTAHAAAPTLELLRAAGVDDPVAALAPALGAGLASVAADGRVQLAAPVLAAALRDDADHARTLAAHEALAQAHPADTLSHARHLALARPWGDESLAAALSRAAESARRRGDRESAADLAALAAARTLPPNTAAATGGCSPPPPARPRPPATGRPAARPAPCCTRATTRRAGCAPGWCCWTRSVRRSAVRATSSRTASPMPGPTRRCWARCGSGPPSASCSAGVPAAPRWRPAVPPRSQPRRTTGPPVSPRSACWAPCTACAATLAWPRPHWSWPYS